MGGGLEGGGVTTTHQGGEPDGGAEGGGGPRGDGGVGTVGKGFRGVHLLEGLGAMPIGGATERGLGGTYVSGGVSIGHGSKGLQLRLELGNVVTGEGERGESGSWRLDG